MSIEKYKYDEISEHLTDYLNGCSPDKVAEYLEDSWCELHNDAFNSDYYIIGTYQATQWLGDRAFEVIEFIKEYEQDNFGEVSTDFSDPEKVVNMFVYIVGESVVYSEFWRASVEQEECA
tara:strand:- start:476 stop:835 length:360 start_codon:yes stop_codon:yes gene_type:complete